ncbi:TrbC/VirB2 family protein [Candidatus Parcubacteria bacterium]|nr:TrbC/VirB2 family protein [Candidatus Parcubacteria bacterium]
MEPNNQPNYQMPQSPAPQRPNYNMPAPHHESSWGPIAATVIILAVIILGGLYFWGQRNSTAPTPDSNSSSVNQSSPLNSTSIQTDLNNTDTNNLDAEINAS